MLLRRRSCALPDPSRQRHHRGWRRPEFLARQAAHPTGLVGWLLAHIMLPAGRVVGLDPSATMTRLAARYNRGLIARGKARVEQGDAAALQYGGASFDRILATHTVYVCPDLGQVARELRRVLKPHGRLVLGFGDVDAMRQEFPQSVYTLRSADQIRDALKDAGFADVRVESRTTAKRAMHWAIAE